MFGTAYDAASNKAATMGDIKSAKDALVGTTEDKSGVDTIKGAKKYTDEKAASALTDAKAYADGLVTGDTGVSARIDALETKVDVAKVSTAIAAAKNEAIADADAKNATLKTAILGTDHTGTVKDAAEAAAAAQNAVDALSGKVGTIAEGKTAAGLIADNTADISDINTKIGTVPANKTVVGMITEATYDDAAVRGLIATNKTAIDTLIGAVEGDNAKSAREMAHEEVAKVVDGAPKSFDTLKEISSWISEHSDSALAMDTSIKANTAAIEKLNGADTVAGSVAKSVKDGVTPVANRVTALEGKVTDDKITQWNAGQANKIESIKANGAALAIGTDKSVTLPTATAAALGLVKVDNTSIGVTDGGSISVKEISTDKLKQGTMTLIFNCGDASTLV